MIQFSINQKFNIFFYIEHTLKLFGILTRVLFFFIRLLHNTTFIYSYINHHSFTDYIPNYLWFYNMRTGSLKLTEEINYNFCEPFKIIKI